MNKTELLKLRADPATVQKLDQLAASQTGGNRSKLLRMLIDQAASSQHQPQTKRQ